MWFVKWDELEDYSTPGSVVRRREEVGEPVDVIAAFPVLTCSNMFHTKIWSFGHHCSVLNLLYISEGRLNIRNTSS